MLMNVKWQPNCGCNFQRFPPNPEVMLFNLVTDHRKVQDDAGWMN